jgi:hypothetical protein
MIKGEKMLFIFCHCDGLSSVSVITLEVQYILSCPSWILGWSSHKNCWLCYILYVTDLNKGNSFMLLCNFETFFMNMPLHVEGRITQRPVARMGGLPFLRTADTSRMHAHNTSYWRLVAVPIASWIVCDDTEALPWTALDQPGARPRIADAAVNPAPTQQFPSSMIFSASWLGVLRSASNTLRQRTGEARCQ